MKRILLLTAAHGAEDEVAARNLQQAFQQLAPGEVQFTSLDLVEGAAGKFAYLLRPTFSFLRELAAEAWSSPRLESALASVHLDDAEKRLHETLDHLQPDLVLAEAPLYGALVAKLFVDGRMRDFAFVALVVDAATETTWPVFPADFFVVMNEEAKLRMTAAGIEPEKIKPFGFPVQLPPSGNQGRRAIRDRGDGSSILYIVNGARRKAAKILERMLRRTDWKITVCVPDDLELEQDLRRLASSAAERVEVRGQVENLPALLRRHDVVVSRANTEIFHEVVAAGCPLIVPKVSRDEAPMVATLRRANAGALAEKPGVVVDWLDRAFREKGTLLALWRQNLAPLAGKGSTPELVRFLLQAASSATAPRPLRILPEPGRTRVPAGTLSPVRQLLLCDFHTHSTWSDGKLTIRELVDFYGQRGFDCLCVTDHLCDPQRLLGKLVNLTGLVIPPGQTEAYFAAIEREKKRARAKYDLLLMTGVEFNKDGYTAKTSTHLLGVDLREPINPSLGLKELIREIHAQGGLAIASHPHEIKGHWGKNTLHLWENIDEYAPLIDAWEVANRDDIFNPIGLKKLPFIANSDFHKPKHIHSWKTLLYCEKDPEAIKQCIRLNRDVSLTLYRDHRFGAEEERAPLVANRNGSSAPTIQNVSG